MSFPKNAQENMATEQPMQSVEAQVVTAIAAVTSQQPRGRQADA